ncbi:MAG TPA: bifunctional 4-hydroxy-2-oxoglutarate aldolase/2-dehydro-3-deoxy-phosphogluconate aldolase [Candidatus Baltobacteraceae bacterium]|nr:bifunctional 4-hydroxy-2-oxoglutarate aldolase/2-dehydro-3-deoxy-phosphogluconate aldolase [Candidatus Baltobacteraceae bacterium]
MKDAMLREIIGRQSVLPILTIPSVLAALRIAENLLAGGIHVMEITLRTEQAPAGIRAVRDRYPEMAVGAGTLLRPEDFDKAGTAGAQFAVSPGLDPALGEAGAHSPLPFLPGVQTASEVMQAIAYGFTTLKFYPARAAGGPPVLADFGRIFPDVLFVPTGKLGQSDVPEYLALPNVIAVGGGWVTPAERIAAQEWGHIRRLAEEATKITRPKPGAGNR